MRFFAALLLSLCFALPASDVASFAPATAPATTLTVIVPQTVPTVSAPVSPSVSPPAVPAAPTLWTTVTGLLWDARLEIMIALVTGIGYGLDRLSKTAQAAALRAVSIGHSIFLTCIDTGLVKAGNLTALEEQFWAKFQERYGSTFNAVATDAQENIAHNAFLDAVKTHVSNQ